MRDKSTIRVACAQFSPRFGQSADNVQRLIELARQAKSQGADLVVFPELCNTGYAFETRAELATLAEASDAGPTVMAWKKAASELGIHLVGGFAERSDTRLFNSAVLLSPTGVIGCYRKTHLSDREKDLFDPGDNDYAAYQTPLGRISILICYDIWFPETMRACALRGADIVCVPTNWSNLRDPQQDHYPMAVNLLMAAAHCNGVFVACANRVGREGDIEFNGQSVLVDKSGWLIGPPLSRSEIGIKVESIDVGRARDKHISDRNSVIDDRRTDLYE